jgi:hypothetical protein
MPWMRTQHLFRVCLLLAVGLLVGCLPTYVGNPDTAKINPDLVGLWHRNDGQTDQIWAVHRMNDHTYMAQSYQLEKSGEAFTLKSSAATRMWLAEIGGKTFMSMQMFVPDTLLEAEPQPKVYIVAKLTLKDGSLDVQGVESKMGENAKTPAELEKIIADNLDKAELYTESQTYQKITPANRDQFAKMLEAVD